jgi:hypothetical protein
MRRARRIPACRGLVVAFSGANAAQLALLRPGASPGVYVAEMPADAQLTRNYDECLGRIAARLVLSVRIVDSQVAAVLEKLNAPTRRDAATRARALGLCR